MRTNARTIKHRICPVKIASAIAYFGASHWAESLTITGAIKSFRAYSQNLYERRFPVRSGPASLPVLENAP